MMDTMGHSRAGRWLVPVLWLAGGCIVQADGRAGVRGQGGPPPPPPATQGEVVVYADPARPTQQVPATPATGGGGGGGEVVVEVDVGASSWQRAQAMPSARSYLAAAAIGTRIYVTGGLAKDEPGGNGVTARLLVLDTTTGAWTAGADAPTRRYSHASVALDGKIYVVGGHGDSRSKQTRLATAERYDPATNRWQAIASMAQPHHEPALAAVDGKLYVFGGEDGPSYLASVEVYDPARDRWTRRADMPRARKGGSAAVVGGKVYLFGGSEKIGHRPAEVDVYDPAADRWSTVAAPMPTARWMGTATTVGGHVVIAGGATTNGTTYVREVDVFDPAAGTWSTITTLPSDRGNAAAVFVGGNLYLLGGCRSGCNEKIGEVDVLVFGRR
jgi:N-acetylneuraminic acid mutarotase